MSIQVSYIPLAESQLSLMFITSERHLWKKCSLSSVMEAISKDQFGNPKMVEGLLSSLISFSIGLKVLLSNGEEAEVIDIDRQSLSTPTVRRYPSGEVLSLAHQQDLSIADILRR